MAEKRHSRSTARTQSSVHEVADDNIEQEGAADALQEGAATQSEVMQHAEEMVDEMGQRVGEWATRFSKNVQRMAARAREEMEDMWAEAQSLRRGEHLETSHVDAQSLNSSTAQDEED